MSNILGFILIASACNYFLVTRLTSKQDKDTTVNKRRGQNRNAFETCQAEEDIILPGIPVINREATWPESVAGSKTPFIQEPGQAVSDTDMATNDETYMVNKVQKQVVQEQPAEKLKKPDETVGIYLSQVFSDRTVILGKPSDNIPYLLSNLNPSEKLLLNKKAILIGRLKDNVDYTINNRAVGKIHAEMINKGGKYYIIDLNSVNGTYVNGERLVCNTETLIKNGDKITFANEPFTFIAS
ncbi:MAG: FHA domain-containing protein [Clostridiales bacterium]|nr:FHA domain-containing protein [Clostridiales bacterium]